MAAAVSDYTPIKVSKTKIKKADQDLAIKLKPAKDILKWAGKNKSKNQTVVGFALEDQAIRKNAEKKLTEKKLDMIIANAPSAIGAEKSAVQIKTTDSQWIELPTISKLSLAKKIIRRIETLRL